MKIAYIHQYFKTPSEPGGTRSYEMARRLAKEHKVYMITSDTLSSTNYLNKWNAIDIDNIRVYRLSNPYSNNMSYKKRLVSFFRFFVASTLITAKLKPDLILASSTPLSVGLSGVLAARQCKVPLVFEVRDLWPDGPIALGVISNPLAISASRYLERFIYNNSDRIIALSPGMAKGIVKTGYPKDRISVIPNSCDFDLFNVPVEHGLQIRKRYSWLKDRPMLIYAGTFGFVNNLSYMVNLAAATRILDSSIRFVAIGSGREFSKIQMKAKELNVLNKNFFMFNAISKDQIPYWLAATDMCSSFVLPIPEVWNNSANKFFDSLAASRPIAINYLGWQADMISKNQCGVILDPTDTDLSSNLLVMHITNRSWLSNASLNAKRLGEEAFSRDALFQKLDILLHEAINEHTR